MSTRFKGGYAERLFAALISAVVGLTLAGILYNFSAVSPPAATVTTTPLRFTGAKAMAVATEFATTFPNRNAGNPVKAQSAQWIVDHFVEMGYDPQVQSFGAWVKGTYYPDLATVWAVRRGITAETLVVFAHYDTPAFVDEGATDDASGVGVIFELASILTSEVPQRSIVFVLFDGSEYGLTGSKLFTSREPFPDPILAAVGLDFINTGDMAGVSVECLGTGKGYTPVWLRTLATGAAQAQSGKAFTPSAAVEWVERSVAVAPTDAGVFLRHRVAAVNLAGVPVDPAVERAVYHTKDDSIENLTLDSFQKWGRTAEAVIRSVDEMGAVPRGRANVMVYLGLAGGGYLPGWAVRFIQLLIFAPLWGVVGLGWYWRRKHRAPAVAVVLAEARRVFALAGCLFVGLLGLKLMTVFGIVARYEGYPATARDPFLYHPAIVPVLLALALAGAAVYAVWRYTLWLTPPASADWPERYHAFTTILAVVVFLVWLEGAGFAAVTFLALPSYLWLLLAEPAGRQAGLKKGLGALLVLAGTGLFVAYLVVFGQVFVTGPAWWYTVLAATYGLFSLKASACFLTMAALHWEAFSCTTGIGAGRVLPSEAAPPRHFAASA